VLAIVKAPGCTLTVYPFFGAIFIRMHDDLPELREILQVLRRERYDDRPVDGIRLRFLNITIVTALLRGSCRKSGARRGYILPGGYPGKDTA
jgi:hypothetical protein